MTTATPPSVMWAQRSGVIFLTICLEDCQSPEIKIEPNRVYFKGTGGTDKKLHEVEINLYKEIEPEKCEQAFRGRVIELTLRKKNGEDSEFYWPQLTKEKAKHHWLKVDFNRWQDEESSGDEEEGGLGNDYNLSEMGTTRNAYEVKPNQQERVDTHQVINALSQQIPEMSSPNQGENNFNDEITSVA